MRNRKKYGCFGQIIELRGVVEFRLKVLSLHILYNYYPMKTATSLALILLPLFSAAETIQVSGPDSRLVLTVDAGSGNVTLLYSINYDGKPMLAPSPLGFLADTGNYSDSLSLKGHEVTDVHVGYSLPDIKKSTVEKNYKRLSTRWVNNRGLPFEIEFMVGDNDVAFRYVVPRQNERGSIRVMNEKTGFRLPENSTAFLTPQSEAMIGWKRTKPSYEERYVADVPMTEKSDFGHGYTFPGLFHTPDGGWVLVSETGVDSRYCASHLSDYTDGVYEIAFPMPEENNGNGTGFRPSGCHALAHSYRGRHTSADSGDDGGV